jgi:carbamoyltransferase
LLREGPFKDIWIQPAAGDAGGALGAALAFTHQQLDLPRPSVAPGQDRMRAALLGPAYSDEEIATSLAERGIAATKLDEAALHRRVATEIARGKVVGRFQGRAEFGPRALGNRSILADARSPEMQRVLNLKIKFRESFRPFAPIVLAEHAAEYFELAVSSPYMLLTAPVVAQRRVVGGHAGEGQLAGLARASAVRSDIPAVTHVDFSARIQTVDRAAHPQLHALLSEFWRQTGCAVIINTSFNVRGEPPVCHPREAIAGFLETGMDALAIGSYFIEKSALDPRILAGVVPRAFPPD